MTLRCASLAIVVVCALASRAAFAAGPGDAVAEALFEQARIDMRRGAFVEACPKLEESERIDPSSGTLLNLMVCEERIGKLASAWQHGRELIDRLDDGDERKAIAVQRVAALARRVPTLVVRPAATGPADTRVVLDGVDLGRSSLGIALPIDPGVHRLVVSVEGRPDRRMSVDAQEGGAYEEVAEPSPALPAVASAPGARPFARGWPSRTTPSSAARATGWVAVSTGIGGFVASGVLGLLTLERAQIVRSVCPAKQCESAAGLQAASEGRAFSAAAVFAFSVGVAGTGLGVYYLESARPPAPSGIIVRWADTF